MILKTYPNKTWRQQPTEDYLLVPLLENIRRYCWKTKIHDRFFHQIQLISQTGLMFLECKATKYKDFVKDGCA